MTVGLWLPRQTAVSTRQSRHVCALSILCYVFLLVSALEARADEATLPERSGGDSGIGIVLGDVNGISFKFWPVPAHGVQVHLGSPHTPNAIELVAAYQYHFRPVNVPDAVFSVPFYLGLGTRCSIGPSTYLQPEGGFSAGPVAVGGMSIVVPDLPVEVFFELRPSLTVYQTPTATAETLNFGFLMEGGLGVHYYF